ncbi:MAG: tetratricopeptide repeat protein [Kofleriaceae bacterium]
MDLDARYQYGAALWNTGDAAAAERQLVQVTAKTPDNLQARRVLVLIHASRGDTSKLVSELEAIANRAPFDLDVKLDLATAYSALNRWDRASAQLEHVSVSRPGDFALVVRIGDTKRRGGDVNAALAWYARAQRLIPDSSYPGFSAAQTLFEARRFPEAIRAYTNLQRYRDDLAMAEHALGTIALLQSRPDDAAWYFRRSVRGMPRVVEGWRSLVAAELSRRDPEQAQKVVERALVFWPQDPELHYLAGVIQSARGDRGGARARMKRTLELAPGHVAARTALGALDAQGMVALAFVPTLVRPWGDAQAIERTIAQYEVTHDALAQTRTAYQAQFLKLLATLGKGPYTPGKVAAAKTCPLARVAPLWASGTQQLRRYERLGGELEATYRFLARHDEIGATAALLPTGRARVASAKRSFRVALADVGELRAEWLRGLAPELRAVGCTEKLLTAAVADPERYRVIVEDRPTVIPQTQPPRPKPRATFYIDNTNCPDAVDVWIDGEPLGQVAPGRRSALVADGGERTLCLIVPGAAQCGDRGTSRQVYLHDGWAATMQCPK